MIAGEPGRWHLIAGEYPPVEGGIADYSAMVARGLAGAGAEVHVWTTGARGASTSDEGGVTVHRAGRGWSRGDLARVARGLDAYPSPRRLLVQYAPNSWGFKGMNLGFARWLAGRARRGDHVDSMIHEVCYIPGPGERRAIRRLLPLVQRPMARRVLAASTRVFVATPRWADLLGPLDPRPGRSLDWLAVPSTIPVVDDPEGSDAIRARIRGGAGLVVGSFGTFSNAVAGLLREVLPGILADDPARVGLLIGRNAEGFAAQLIADHPGLAGRVTATGGLAPSDLSRHLLACDLLVQPYPDGACGRRTTLMAAIAHGVATVTTVGGFTPPAWRDSGAIAFAEGGDPAALIRVATGLLADPGARATMGRAGRDFYRGHFAIERTIEALLGGDRAHRVETAVDAPVGSA